MKLKILYDDGYGGVVAESEDGQLYGRRADTGFRPILSYDLRMWEDGQTTLVKFEYRPEEVSDEPRIS